MKKIIFLFSIIIFSSTLIVGQENSKSDISRRGLLNGHTFQSLSHFNTPFVTTNLNARFGFGQTPALNIAGIDIDGHEILAFKGQLVFVNMDVRYQQRFNPWLAMYITGNISGRLGTDMSSILADGINTLTGGKIGWLIRVMNREKFILSANFHVANVTGNFINVTEFIEEIINDEPYPSVIKKVPAMNAAIGLRGAYAFNATYGIQFIADFAYGESFERGRSQGYGSGGIMGEMDFNPKYRVPIGLALGYIITSSPEMLMSDSGVSNFFIGKIGYSGSGDFELGLQFSYYDVNLRSIDAQTYVSQVLLILNFFF